MYREDMIWYRYSRGAGAVVNPMCTRPLYNKPVVTAEIIDLQEEMKWTTR